MRVKLSFKLFVCFSVLEGKKKKGSFAEKGGQEVLMDVGQLKGFLLGGTPPKPAPKGMFPWEMEWDIKAASSGIWQNVMLHLSPFSI